MNKTLKLFLYRKRAVRVHRSEFRKVCWNLYRICRGLVTSITLISEFTQFSLVSIWMIMAMAMTMEWQTFSLIDADKTVKVRTAESLLVYLQ